MRIKLLLCVVPFLFVSTAFAQFRGSIRGTVTDPSGDAVASAKVTVTNQDTGVSQVATTNDLGFYVVSELPPGRYTVVVEAKSFKQSTSKDIEVLAEQPRGLDIPLQIGEVSEKVTVAASAEGLQTQNASIEGTFSNRQVERLPQFGRDPYELLNLAPGVMGDNSRFGNGLSAGFPNGAGAGAGAAGGPGGSNQSIFQTENQIPISANGQRVTSNDYTIDGISVNSLNWGGAAVITPTQESVQEITVIANDYSAEDGRNTGAHIKVISKGGTNQVHGSAFIFDESPGLNSYNKFGGYDPGVGNAPPVRVDNNFKNFGGSVGGPIIKDKLFFFFAYEGLRSRNTTFDDQYVETPQFDSMLSSLYGATPTGTIVGQSNVAPRIAQMLPTSCALWIAANQPCQVVPGGINIGSPTGTYGSYVNAPQGGGLTNTPDLEFAEIYTPSTLSDNQYNGRVDYVRGRDTFSASTFITQYDNIAADDASAARPMDDFSSKRFSPAGFLSWISAISPNTVNEARFNFTRFAYDEITSNPNVDFGIPRIEIQGLPLPAGGRIRYGAPQSATEPGIFAQNTFGAREVFSHLLHNHAMKYGFEWSHEQNNSDPLGGARPDFVFQGPWNFANGAPIFEQIAVDPLTGAPTGDTRHFRTSTYGAFIQDDWRVRSNFTLNIGLRYDYFTPLSDADGQLTNLILGTGATALATSVIGFPSQMTKPNRLDFGPRIGFAWSPSTYHNNLVVRGGGAIAYDRIEDTMFINSAQDPPYYANYGICCGTSATPFVGGQILYELGQSNSPLSFAANPALAGGIDPVTHLPVNANGLAIWGDPYNMPTPYAYLYSLQIQYQAPANWVLTLGYQGSEGRHLLRIKNLNYFYTIPNPELSPLNGNAIYFPTTDGTSNYNALISRLEHRFSHGAMVTVDYTFSKSLDELSNDGPGFTTNQTYPLNQATEYGPSDFDATHNIRVFGLWDLPIARTRQDWIGKIAGGWQLNGIFQFHSGFPWTPVSFSNCYVLGTSTVCPVRPYSYNGKALGDMNTNAFLPSPYTNPAGGSINFPGGGVGGGFFNVSNVVGALPYPGVGRNSFRGPRFSSFDFSLAKQFGLPTMRVFGDKAKLELRMSAFNAFNKLNLAPFTFGSASTDVNNPQFGTAASGLAGRVLELQGRFTF